MAFENAKLKANALGVCGSLKAFNSILRSPSFTVAVCSLGSDGTSAGSADEKDHSSSSFAGAAATAAGLGVAGLDPNLGDARAAKGSLFEGVAALGGCPKAEKPGCGVVD